MLPNQKQADDPTPAKVNQRFYYGWVVAIAGASIMLLNAQFIYTFGIFVRPLIDTFGWSRAAISSIASVRSTITALLSPVAGTLSDRYKPRGLILSGVLLCGLGFILSGQANQLWHFYLSLGVCIGVANSIIITPTLATVNKWFSGKSALANGITMTGPSLAQILVPPVATFLIINYRWEISVIIIGVAVWLLGILSWSFVRTPPPANQLPHQMLTTPAGRKPQSTEGGDFTLSEALHTTGFWILFLIYTITAICFQMVVVHIVVAAIDIGAAASAAALILTIMGITNTLGRLALSSLADRIGKILILTIAVAGQAGLLLLLAQAGNLSTFYIITAVYALFYGSVIPNVLSLSGTFFGVRAVGGITGALTLGYLVGGAAGPLLAGHIFDVTGSYHTAFLAGAIISALAFVLCLLLKAPRKTPGIQTEIGS